VFNHESDVSELACFCYTIPIGLLLPRNFGQYRALRPRINIVIRNCAHRNIVA
jgi:hypothetical protein